MRRAALVGAAWIVLGVTPAAAFKLKTHIYTANIIMDDVVDGSVYLPGLETMHRFQVGNGPFDNAALNAICDLVEPTLACRVPTGPELQIRNELLREAVFLFPEMVRGGVLGPDAFPDFIWGQQSTHVNHGRTVKSSLGGMLEPTQLRSIFGGDNQGDIYSGIPFITLVPAGVSSVMLVPHFNRDPLDPYTWRAIDYGVYLLGKAYAWNADAPRGSARYLDRLRAIAFSFGYLLHISGDSNMHTILNRQVGSYFDMLSGAGLFGPLTEEVKHLTAEGLVDAHMTPGLFGPVGMVDPNSVDPKLPGTNGVVAHGAIVPPAGLSCPAAPIARWAYCNPIDASDHLTGSCVDRPGNPYGACDPWRELCYSPEQAAAQVATVCEGLDKCAQRSPNTCSDPSTCRLAPYADALKPLPSTCDPDDIHVTRDAASYVRERSNACIAANCAFDATKCPQPGLLGFEDREARAPACSTDPERFGTNRAAFLSGTKIAAPTDFLYLTMVEDPKHEISDIASLTDASTTTDWVAKRGVGGPYLKGLLALRDDLKNLAELSPMDGGLRGVSLDPARFGQTISALANTSTAAGRFLRGLGDGLDRIQRGLDQLSRGIRCVLSFGLVCATPESPPLFTPSVMLGRRAALIDEQLRRYLDMSVCLAQNMVDGAQTDGPVIVDHCDELTWYRENHRIATLARAHLMTALGAPPETGPSFLQRCLGVREHPEEPHDTPGVIDHGSFGLTLKTAESFLVDDTFLYVLSLHAEDLGIAVPEFAQLIWVELNVLVADYLTAPLSDVFSKAAGGICSQIVAANLPDAQAIGWAMTNLERTFGSHSEELAVAIAFLREDALSDVVYGGQVRSILAAIDPALAATFDTLLTNPPTSENQFALQSQAVVDALLGSAQFAALDSPQVRHLKGYFGMDRTANGDVLINRAWPVWNTLQLGKLVALGLHGIEGLEAAANAIPALALPVGSIDADAADLLHAARAGKSPELDLATDLASFSVLYQPGPDPWCGTVDSNLLCNAVPSLDDPDDYEHYGMPGYPFAVLDATNQRTITPGPQRNRSTLMDRVILDTTPDPDLAFDISNFAVVAPHPGPNVVSTSNVTRVFGNVFGPYTCNNPGSKLQDRLDRDVDGIVDACDNCPLKYNPGQEDRNLDAVGDICDPTATAPAIPPVGMRSPPAREHVAGCDGSVDSDHDLVGDACDVCPGGDDFKDADRDGVPDGCDFCPGVRSEDRSDADGDRIPDVCDLCPAIAEQAAEDSDCDEVGDRCDNCPSVSNRDQLDSDGNGVGDACEDAGCGGCRAGAGGHTTGLLLFAVGALILRRRRR